MAGEVTALTGKVGMWQEKSKNQWLDFTIIPLSLLCKVGKNGWWCESQHVKIIIEWVQVWDEGNNWVKTLSSEAAVNCAHQSSICRGKWNELLTDCSLENFFLPLSFTVPILGTCTEMALLLQVWAINTGATFWTCKSFSTLLHRICA